MKRLLVVLLFCLPPFCNAQSGGKLFSYSTSPSGGLDTAYDVRSMDSTGSSFQARLTNDTSLIRVWLGSYQTLGAMGLYTLMSKSKADSLGFMSLINYVPSNHTVTRSISSSTFTPSTTKQSNVCYNVTISCTASIGSASSGSLSLQYSVDGGTTYTTLCTVSNSNTITLAITLNSVQTSGLQLCGIVPPNALVKMVPTTSGTTTISYLNGNESY